MVIPCTVTIQMLVFGMRFTKEIVASLVVLTLGVGVSTVSQINFIKFEGIVFAIIAVLSTSQVSIVRCSK